MKKLLPLLAFLICLTNLRAQDKYISQKINFNANVLRANKQKTASPLKTSSYNSGWFHYGAMVPNDSYFFGIYLFPDSTASIYSMGSSYPIWAHHVTEVVDFQSPVFGSAWTTSAPSSAPLKIDSLAIAYLYSRFHTNATDTLIVTLFEDVTSGISPYDDKYFLNTVGIPGGEDSIFYKRLGYNQSKNVVAVSSNTNIIPLGQKIFKILLTQADTSVNGKEKIFVLPTPFISNGNKLVCADFQFKPGYSYSLGECINITANAFQFISGEEVGPYTIEGTFMNYYGYMNCRNPANTYCDRGSSSQIITKDIRYNNAGPWNGYLRPAITFPKDWRLEHHGISFHLSDDMTNVCQSNSHFTIFADSLNPGIYNAYNNSSGLGVLSYLWDFGDGTTSSLQYPSHQYSIPGQYTICLTVSATSGTNTCTSTYCDSANTQRMSSAYLMSEFNVIPQIATSVNQIDISSLIRAYPNPIADNLIIENLNQKTTSFNYNLTDALGRIILTGICAENSTTINTSHLSKGVYTLTILNENRNKLKIIKLIK